MTDGCSSQIPRPKARSARWTSFVASTAKGRVVRGLEEETNPRHRVRIEHGRDTLLVHVSDEDGNGWTTIAIDRTTGREPSRNNDGRRMRDGSVRPTLRLSE